MFRLEKLEIFGFKSFADRTSLVFGEGLTGVVGPNGCGKSNIAEAISWVLGEQSAKNLRGGKMEDVIFNGTRDRKPGGMAEVVLTLVATEDIAARDSENLEADERSRYETALEKAEHAAQTARALVEEFIPRSDDLIEGSLTAAPDSQPQQTSGPEDTTALGEPQAPVLKQEEPVEPVRSAAVEEASEVARLVLNETVAAEGGGNEPAAERSAEAADNPEKHPRHKHRAPRRRKPPVIAISAGERITVGRRLYRTGDSDYLMNGRPCLLRDIQDLFAGTGLGGAHYAIIEQGRIGQILSSKPLDRRGLIEEAAGITKFKSRKRAAELKLESTKQNLTRLNDIITEVERQVNSLKRQAQKARRYRRMRDEMRGLQKLVFAADYYRLTEASERISEDLKAAEASRRDLDAAVAGHEAEHRIASTQARAAEDLLTELRERAAAIGLEADRSRNRRAFEEEQLRQTSARIEEVKRDQKALDERLEMLDRETQRRAGELKALEAELIREQADLLAREAQYHQELSRLRNDESELEQLRQRLLGEIGQVERLRNSSLNLDETTRRLEHRQASLQAEMSRATAASLEASAHYSQVGGELEGSRELVASLARMISQRLASLEELRPHASELRTRLEGAQTRRTSAQHRLASLDELDAHRAYYSDAVQYVLSPEQAARINARGTLADFVEVEPQYERLVESLFARELQCVLVPTIDDALAGVEFLRREGLGRGAFLVVGLHGGEEDGESGRRGDTEPGGLGDSETPQYGDAETGRNGDWETRGDEDAQGARRDDKIDSVPVSLSQISRAAEDSPARFQLDVLEAIALLGLRAELKTVVERAFPEKCHAYVVPDIEAALHLSLENQSRIYVTYDGEQVVNGRLIVAGAQATQKEASLLALKREIRDLRAREEALRVEEEQIASEFEGARAQVEETERQSAALDQELREQEKVAAARETQLQAAARELERAQQHVRVVETELAQSAREMEELRSRRAQLTVELADAEASREAAQESVAVAQSSVAELRGRVDQFAEQLSIVRASVAARSERLHAARTEVRRLEGEAEELRSRINRNRIELYESHGRVEQLRASVTEGEQRVERLERERASLEDEIGAAGEAQGAARARTDELEALLTDLRQQAAAAHDRSGQIQVERARVESEAEHLTRTCFSELAMTLQDVITSVELERAAVDQEGAGEPEGLGRGEPDEANDEEGPTSETAAWHAAPDVDAARARLDELRVKLDEMGPVNMMALEELEESDRRFRFLSEQRRDIVDSVKSTEEALAEIKRRSRERFRHAFEHVNKNFQQMFVELFGGGRGEMILIDEEDVLESGIDLIAQPPGKRLQNVLLLSGGEKAMAAIALVLAIFQYRPSPFCILDEVDAPLDEMNVGRFSDKVIEMSRETQFLLITHNKRTMEAARALYGVTMEERGVSKLVSVKFE